MIVVLSLLASIAHAQDTTGDGCLDAYFDDNGACVAPSAQLGSGVTVQANAVIAANAQLGEDIDVGQRALIGTGATLIGRVSALGPRPVGNDTIIARRVFIDADHDLGAGGMFGRAATTGERLVTEDNVSLGYAASVGNDVFLGSGSTLGNLVTVGNNTRVEAGTVLGRNVTVTDSASPLEPATVAGIIGPNVTIGSGADLHTSVRIRRDTTLGNNVTILSGVRIGRDASIGNNVTLGQNVRIDAGGIVTATTQVPDGTRIRRGETYDDPNPLSIAGMTEVVTLPNGATMTFRGIGVPPDPTDTTPPYRTFEMGCKPGRDDVASGVDTGVGSCSSATWNDGRGLHSVTLTHEFWCGETEVTQAQFAAAPGSPAPSYFSPTGTGSWAANTPNPPVERVSWPDAAWYANWLTSEYNATNGTSLSQCYTCSGTYSTDNPTAPGCAPVADLYACDGFRLPTEAEWEYAARGGESHPYSGSSSVDVVGWYMNNNGSWITPTGGTKSTATKAANAFGLHDMTGNVWEWTNDWSNLGPYSTDSVVDPLGPESGSERPFRGGYFGSEPRDVLAATRYSLSPDNRSRDIGFRLCKSVP